MWVWLLEILSQSVFPGVVGRIWLLTSSLQLVVAPIPSSVISGFPLLVIGGRLVGTILLSKHLSQRC